MIQSYDRFLFNGSIYTVDKLIEDLAVRYGGVDALFLWPTYENIGLDDRNQIGLFEAMPGGLSAVRDITEQFQKKGVNVMWGYNPWLVWSFSTYSSLKCWLQLQWMVSSGIMELAATHL
jgi:hypothetical protein